MKFFDLLTCLGSHANLKRSIVEGYSLVYTLPGSRSDLKPLMLTGHLDVVPAYVLPCPFYLLSLIIVPSLTALDRWTYPPFEGKISGDWLYGRGAGDCKNNVIGILSAVEHLLEEGWVPQRSFGKFSLLIIRSPNAYGPRAVLAFGQDEEISGPRGAANIAKFLQDLYGQNGIAMIVDEGGMGVDVQYGSTFALPGVTEKGYMVSAFLVTLVSSKLMEVQNAIITVDMLGGQ